MSGPPKQPINFMPIQKWMRDNRVPYVHGCVWDRYCRWAGSPPRVALEWGRHSWWCDLDDWFGGIHHHRW